MGRVKLRRCGSSGRVISFALSASLVFGCSLVLNEEKLHAGCPEGLVDCAGECVLPDDPLCCGAGSKICAGICVSEQLVRYGCANPQCEPCFYPHAQAECDGRLGECVLASCTGAFSDCDDETENGCETDTDYDPEHCGSCGHRCDAPPGGQAGCSAGICAILRCDVGLLDCDGRDVSTPQAVTNGCEVDSRSDPQNCGACGVSCDEGETCRDGVCRSLDNE